jgi:hypothetical protein
MPTILRFGTCTIEGDLAESTVGLSEAITDRGVSILDSISALDSSTSTMTTNLTNPLSEILGSMLALPLDQARSLLCLPPVGSTTDVEQNLRDRDGINVVNGRVLVPGTLDVTCLRTLTVLLRSYETAINYARELTEGTFLFVVTHIRRVVVPATLCTPESTTEEEVLLGVNVAIPRILRDYSLTESDLKLYVFWRDYANPTPENLNRLVVLGLSSEQVAQILVNDSTDRLYICILREVEQLERLGTIFGSSAEAVILRGPSAINLFPETNDLLTQISNALTQRRPGSITSCGTRDFTDPAIDILTAVDFDLTFNVTQVLLECTNTESGSDAVAGILAGILNTIMTVIRNAMQGLRLGQLSLTNTTALLSILQSLLGEDNVALLACLARSVTVPGVGSLTNYLNRIRDTLSSGLDSFDTCTASAQHSYGLLSVFFCLAQNILNAICAGNFNNIPGLSCVNLTLSDLGVNIPSCIGDVCKLMSDMLGILNGAIGTAIGSLQEVKLLAESLLNTLISHIGVEAAAVATGSGITSLHRGSARTDSDLTSPACNPLQAQVFFALMATTFGTTGESAPPPSVSI